VLEPRASWPRLVERPYRYVREDFFLGRRFRDLDDLNAQFDQWRDQIANRRRHGTTGRIVLEHVTEEKPALGVLPAGRFDDVLALERLNRTGFPGGPDFWKDGVHDEQDDAIEGVSGGAA